MPGVSVSAIPGAHGSLDLGALVDARLLPELPDCAQLAVALSAGADSAMLAVHAAHAAAALGIRLHCLHIHHGLQDAADGWQQHAHQLAALLRVNCHSLRVQVTIRGDGMEAAARAARYQGLTELAHELGVRHILLAHHQNDQAETVLLRLLRGAGPTGLAAMAPASQRAGISWLRPWLAQPRARILQAAANFGAATGWQPVRDPSNTDSRYARGALRSALIPVLDAHWPAWRQNLARHAHQAAEQNSMLAQYCASLWQNLAPAPDGSFGLAPWRALAPHSQAALIRHWLQAAGLRMPTSARLRELLRQLRGVHALGHDRSLRLQHDGHWICVRRGRVYLQPEGAAPAADSGGGRGDS